MSKRTSKKKANKVSTTSGKRKSATARATVTKGKGRVRVNSQPVEIVTPELARLRILEPLAIAGDVVKEVDIAVVVSGGGTMGQAAAVRTAIARGLVDFTGDTALEERYRRIDRGLLVNDSRQREPKHQLGRGARKKRQKSYR